MSNSPEFPRRHLLMAGAGLCLAMQARRAPGAEAGETVGAVVGQPQGAMVGLDVLAAGGNAVDAAVAAALVAGVVAISQCGIGGYGGHMIVGFPNGNMTALDFNSAAPAAARPDMYTLDAQGRVVGGVNTHGWLAAGVPGTLAGLQLALDRFGSRPFSRLVEPAIRYARDGFAVELGTSRAIHASAPQFRRDAASARLFLPDGAPLAEGAKFTNPDLAVMLERLAADNSVAAFYRGPIAEHIAREFKKHGGLVNEQDLAAYEAREVAPLALDWNGSTIHTAPLTAGGASVLQALTILKALHWETWDPADPKTSHARVEALRLAWHDRLSLLGDPSASEIPLARLLSPEYSEAMAARVRAAVDSQRLIPLESDGRSAGGTVHLTAVDVAGMMAAITLTHGEGFGARITVDGLGLVLGHGMSRFDPRPGHPNSPRAGRRPLNNMCPSIVSRQGRPVVALGATGGRRIPNTLCDVLVHLVGKNRSLSEATATPRLHTEGDAKLQLSKEWDPAVVDRLRHAGYAITPGAGANFNAIARGPGSGALTHAP